MEVTSLDLIRARDAAQHLLDQLGLENYLFEVEPWSGEWRLKVECSADEGWRTTTLSMDKAELIASATNGEIHQRLMDQWRTRLDACRRDSR